ncbi:MAG: adenosine-specific kinase, partial [Candidatus Odinarchaeia archaeon]
LIQATIPGTTNGTVKFACAMNEAEPKLTRVEGNDEELKELTAKNALKIGASHVFVIMMEGAWPINLLNNLKMSYGVVNLYVGSANPLKVIVAEDNLGGDVGRAVLGVIDGKSVDKIENEEQRQQRKDLVRKIGYLMG